METREILTLQFGHYSNFVGTHWWNIQESGFEYNSSNPSNIDHDVLFREGLTYKGQVTFTPRLLSVDLKGSLKAFPESGGLYIEPKAAEIDINRHENVEVKAEEREQKILFQEELDNAVQPKELLQKRYDLEKDVRVWSDFLYTRFHPRTINIINEYCHEGENSDFNIFPLGSNLWKTEQFSESFSDKIRNYVEECNRFQGFQIILDATNAFSGLATSCIEYLRDEYDTKSILSFPIIPSHYTDYVYDNDEKRYQSLLKDANRALNVALCFESLSEHNTLFAPLCTSVNGWRQPGPKREFYHLIYNHQLPYHTSAIIASTLDTLSLKYRLKSTEFTLSDLCTDFTLNGRKAAAASVCLPFSFNEGSYFIDCLDNWEGPLTRSITPSCTIGTDKLTQMLTLQGIPEDRLKPSNMQATKYKDMSAYKCNSVNEMLSFYMKCNYFLTINDVTTVAKGLPVRTPYPNIFDEFVGVNGNIVAIPKARQPESVAILAGFHTGACVGDMLESLHTDVKKIKYPRFHQFRDAGLESDEFNERLNRLLDLRECYIEDYGI